MKLCRRLSKPQFDREIYETLQGFAGTEVQLNVGGSGRGSFERDGYTIYGIIGLITPRWVHFREKPYLDKERARVPGVVRLDLITMARQR